jgi:glutamate--cysteine ligase
MRGADGGPWNRICALPAFWVGLLYDQSALDAAWDVVKDWTMDERQNLRDSVPEKGFAAPIGNGRILGDIAGEILSIASSGLAARGRLNSSGDNETGFLEPLHDIVRRGKTPAEDLLALYNGEWGKDLSAIYDDFSF